jgi:hypothetical protein
MYHPVCPSLPHHVVLTGRMARACLTYVATPCCTTLVLSPRTYLRCADGAVPHPHRISQALPFSPAPPCYGNLAFSKINVQASPKHHDPPCSCSAQHWYHRTPCLLFSFAAQDLMLAISSHPLPTLSTILASHWSLHRAHPRGRAYLHHHGGWGRATSAREKQSLFCCFYKV